MSEKVGFAIAGMVIASVLLQCTGNEHEVKSNVQLTWDFGERYNTIYSDPNDPRGNRDWYVLYKIKNNDPDHSVSMLRFICSGGSGSRYEPKDIPPKTQAEGKLYVYNSYAFDPTSCKPEYDMVR